MTDTQVKNVIDSLKKTEQSKGVTLMKDAFKHAMEQNADKRPRFASDMSEQDIENYVAKMKGYRK